MYRLWTLFSLSLIILGACNSSNSNQHTPPMPETPYVELMDSALLDILALDAPIETLGDGYTWSEGPLWLPSLGRLIFSDVPENRIYQWNPGEGVSLYLTPSGFTGADTTSPEPGSNGLTLDPQGRLTMCQHGDRRVAYMDAPLDGPQTQFVTLADSFEGKKLNSPNDLVFDNQGNLFFTDPPYGLDGQDESPLKEQTINGVYKLDTTGTLTLMTDELARPNGLAFSPDYQTLYVAQSDPKAALWMAYPITEAGALAEGKVFYDATALVGQEGEDGLPDGLKVHPTGTIFATGPGGVWVFDPTGKAIGKIRTGYATANCAFDDQYQYLYMTADSYLMRIPVKGN